jgi:tetratricopeptide (TPR) repeat protein
MIVSIQSDLKKDVPDFSSVNNKILGFMNIANKIANGKSKLLIGIYDATNLAQSKIIHKKDFGKLEKVFSELVKMDPLLFEARVWYAESLISKGKKREAIDQAEEALKLNPSSDDAYRILISLASENKNIKLLNFYCSKFLNASLGGKNQRFKSMLFNGANLNKFGVELNPKINKSNEIYIHSGINLNEKSNYEIIPSKEMDIKNLNMFFSLIPGVSLEIKKITLFSEQNFTDISQNDFLITSKNSFFYSSKKIIFMENEDEILNIKFDQNYKKVDKIIFDMIFRKLDLSSHKCKLNEKNN